MDPGLIENSVPCFDVCLFLVLFSSVVVSEFCSLLSCVVFTTRLVLYMDANSSTYRVNRGENFSQCLSRQQTTAPGAISILSPTSSFSGWTWSSWQGCRSEAALRALSREYSRQLLEQSVHVCHTLCAGLTGWIKCQLHLLHLLILGRRRHVGRLYFAAQLETLFKL